MNKNVIITGGGTGGHLFAALSFADYVKKQGYHPIFIGSVHGMERDFLKDDKYEYYLLNSRGFVGKSLFDKFNSVINLFASFFKALKYINSKKPLFSIGFGGYTTMPVITSSKFLGIKTAIVEQNSIAGKANKLLQHFSNFVFVNYENSVRFFKNKNTIVVGNPTRKSLYIERREFNNKKIKIGIIGGSRGAKSINRAMMEFSKMCDLDIDVIHQTGRDDYETVKKCYKENNKDWKVYEFIYDMRNFYEEIDFIICRSGAGTLSEIACASLGSLLVPYPFAIYNHQYHNAKIFEDAKAAIILEDKNLSGKSLLDIISSVDYESLRSLSVNASFLCKKDVCEKILRTINGD